MAQARDAGRRRPWRDPMIELGPTRYGKARIRLVKVVRLPDRHVVRDLTVAVALEGDFAAAHTDGDQSLVVPTDTMKNTVEAGIEGLTVMKTAKSSFAGFPRDRYTTLKETQDRIMATKVAAAWRYADGGAGVDFDAAFDRVRGTMLTAFAEHFSPAVQTSIWIIGKAVLEAEPAIDTIHFALPNLHHWTYDLSPFGLENDREIFVATEEPHGLIEATVRRSA